jgi:hypothetical protein
MRTLTRSVLAVALAAPVASAGTVLPPPRPTAALPHLQLAGVPPSCHALAQIPETANPTPALAARMSVASCAAEVRLEALVLTHDDASIKALAEAIRPSLAMLADVARRGDATWQLKAAYARADLFQSLVVRMRNAMPGDTSIEPQLQPWLTRADAAYAEVTRIAAAHPGIEATDAVVASDLASARRLLAPQAPVAH